MLKRADAKGINEYQLINIRDFATDKHQTTDDRPFGGGPGMVMKVEPIHAALYDLGYKDKEHDPNRAARKSRVILTSAKGQAFTQEKAVELSQLDELVIICGHYEGVDERVAWHLADEELRIGDFVLTGGEPAALVMVDAISRLIEGVLGNESSTTNESHSAVGFLGHPQYTRPVEYQGWQVPEILLQGHHKLIEAWRKSQSRQEKN